MRSHRKLHNLSPDDFKHSFGLMGYKSLLQMFNNPVSLDVSRKTDFLPVLANTPAILSCEGVYSRFQRENKKRNFDRTERSVQNSVYTAISLESGTVSATFP